MAIIAYATIQVEGFHCWPEAPAEVAFLRQEHRHLFHIKGCVQVYHDDRDVEFILLGRKMLGFFHRVYPDGRLGRLSCEMLAQQFVDEFDLTLCEVSEDGENGAWIVKDS